MPELRARQAGWIDSLHAEQAMRAAKIDSSAISRIAYDDDRRTLSIWFPDTGRYFYHDVPRAVYEGLARAPSAGRYFNAFIKERYRCTPERRRFRPAQDAQAASGRSSR